MDDIGAILASGPARIGLTLGDELTEALADPRRAVCWVPVGPSVTRLLLVGGPRALRAFTGSGPGWARIEADLVSTAGFAPAALNRALAGMAMEAWLAGDPAALHPCDLLAYGGVAIGDRPLSERLALLRQAIAEIRTPGRWFHSRLLPGSPRIKSTPAAAGLRPLARRMGRPYATKRLADWVMPIG